MYDSMINYNALTEKWAPLLEDTAEGAIKALPEKGWLKKQTALMLENQFKYLLESGTNKK